MVERLTGSIDDLWTVPAPAGALPGSAAGGGTSPSVGRVKVLDVATFLAGPFVATLLADYGADVVKVEPAAGDPYRAYPVSFLAVNQRKRGIALDLAKPEGADVLRALLSDADVLVENFRPGRMSRMGLPPSRCVRRMPDWCTAPSPLVGSMAPVPTRPASTRSSSR